MTNKEWKAFLTIAEAVSALVQEREAVCKALGAYDRLIVWESCEDQMDTIVSEAFDEREEQSK